MLILIHCVLLLWRGTPLFRVETQKKYLFNLKLFKRNSQLYYNFNPIYDNRNASPEGAETGEKLLP